MTQREPFSPDLRFAPAVRWQFDLGDLVFCDPAVAGDTVYIAGIDELFALNMDDGREKWRYRMDNHGSTPVVSNGTVFGCDLGPMLHAVDSQTGERKWTFEMVDGSWKPAVVHDGLVYVASFDGHLYAIDAESGALRWVRNRNGMCPTLPNEILGHGYSSLLMHDGVLYANGFRDTCFAIDAATGEEIWRTSPTIGGGGAPALAGDRLLVPSSGSMVAVDATTGRPIWRAGAGQSYVTSPAVGKGMAYFGGHDQEVHAVSLDDGAVIWRSSTDDAVTGRPIVVDDVVFATSQDGRVYALDAFTGAFRWRFRTSDYFVGGPVYADGVLYIANSWGEVFALQAATPVPVAEATAVLPSPEEPEAPGCGVDAGEDVWPTRRVQEVEGIAWYEVQTRNGFQGWIPSHTFDPELRPHPAPVISNDELE